MSRDWRLFWTDIIKFSRRIGDYTVGMDMVALEADQKTYDAVLRNLELIGEAA